MKNRYIIPVTLFLLTALLVVVGYVFLPSEQLRTDSDRTYTYRVAVVSDEENSTLLEELLEGAQEAGEERDVLVELIGSELPESLSIEDAMNMAIYGKVDGILLRPNGAEALPELIEKAAAHGIPVITVYKDVAQSKRQGFVGSDDFYLGQAYGKQVLALSDPGEHQITVLFPENLFDERGRKYFCQGLESVLGEERFRFDYQILSSYGGLISAEELIQSRTREGRRELDVVLCLDETTTQSVCQLLRDRSLLPWVTIIGSSLTPELAEAVAGGEIEATITMDYRAMGKIALDTLMQYQQYHMTSYYTEVGNRVIGQKEAEEYLHRWREEAGADENPNEAADSLH